METEIEQLNTSPNRLKKPSGHVAAGKKWDTSEKGRIWKAQTIKAKHALHDIIKKRTGLDVFANQRMTLKYAGLLRDGKTTEAKRIIEKVIANAKNQSKKGNKTRKQTHINIPYKNTVSITKNSANFSQLPAPLPQNSANFSQLPAPLPQNSANFSQLPANTIHSNITLPDFLD
jgi:hypothetical protein